MGDKLGMKVKVRKVKRKSSATLYSYWVYKDTKGRAEGGYYECYNCHSTTSWATTVCKDCGARMVYVEVSRHLSRCI